MTQGELSFNFMPFHVKLDALYLSCVFLTLCKRDPGSISCIILRIWP